MCAHDMTAQRAGSSNELMHMSTTLTLNKHVTDARYNSTVGATIVV